MDLGAADFDWDGGNRDKCGKHGVPIAAIESLFQGPFALFPDSGHSVPEERFKAVGRTDNGRYVLIVFTLRKRGGVTLIRPIGARFIHRKEVGYYEKEAAGSDERRRG